MSLVLLLVAAFWATPTCRAQQVTYPPGVYGMWAIAACVPIPPGSPVTGPTCMLNATTTGELVQQDISDPSNLTKCVPTTPVTAPDNGPYTGQLLLANTGVVGILLEVPWTYVDTGTTAPSYNWSAMDDVLTEAWVCGLRVALSLSVPLDNQAPAGPPGLPPWVMQQVENGTINQTVMNLSTDSTSSCGAPTDYTNCLCPATDSKGNCLAPVFWNQTFNYDRVAFIKAAATHIATMLPSEVQQNIVAVVAQPFGATEDDWNIPHTFPSDCKAWNSAGYSTSIMFGAGQMILNEAANAFSPPHFPYALNLKLPIQAEGIALDQGNCMNPTPGTGVDLATQVLSWAYGTPTAPPPPTFPPERFFAQLNIVKTTSPAAVNSQTDPVFNLIHQYQPQVGLQDVSAAVDGAAPGNYCEQNGGTQQNPGTCTPCDSPPVQYATVSQNTFVVVQSYKPNFWEISRGDAATATGPNTTCPIPNDEQGMMERCSMRDVFSAATTQLAQLPLPAPVSSCQVSTTASGLAYTRVSRTFDGTVTLTNISGSAVSGPLQILFEGLSAGVTLANATGILSGTPYLTIPNPPAPGQSVTVSVRFTNPSNAAVYFRPAIYSGSIG